MKLISAADAARLVQSNFTIVISGSGGGHAVPDAPLAEIETRFLAEGQPRDLTSAMWSASATARPAKAPTISAMKACSSAA